jgi:hypothetical protein
VRRIALALSVLVTAFALPFNSAGAGASILGIELESPLEPLTFVLSISGGSCDTGTFDVLSVEANGASVTPLSVTEDESDPNIARIVLPSDTEPGDLAVSASCVDGEFPLSADGETEWASVAITKTVVGPAPSDATFVVDASCVGSEAEGSGGDEGFVSQALPPDFDVDFGFGVAGGVQYLYSDHFVSCAITESQTGGASAVTIDPTTVVLVAPEAFAVNVTNEFLAEEVEIQPLLAG